MPAGPSALVHATPQAVKVLTAMVSRHKSLTIHGVAPELVAARLREPWSLRESLLLPLSPSAPVLPVVGKGAGTERAVRA